MGKETEISWADATFNPWWGCIEVSPGCANCYAHTLASRWGFDVWGPAANTPRREMSEQYWRQPLAWNDAAAAAGKRVRVFCGSMCDVFEAHPQADALRPALWRLIARTPHLDWMLLTKRPENILAMSPWTEPWPHNVWIGTSVEDQRRADERIPILLQVPARVRWLSCEPLLGPVDLWEPRYKLPKLGKGSAFNWGDGVHWVIAGGESGAKARPMHPDWARSLRDHCVAAGVAYHFKQWGEYVPYEMQPGCMWQSQHGVLVEQDEVIRKIQFHHNKLGFARVGKKAAGRLLDDRTWDEVPEPRPWDRLDGSSAPVLDHIDALRRNGHVVHATASPDLWTVDGALCFVTSLMLMPVPE